MAKIVQSQQGDTLDLICWRHYGSTKGAVEGVLAANPGLASLGAVLPFATPVSLPDLDTSTASADAISLWD